MTATKTLAVFFCLAAFLLSNHSVKALSDVDIEFEYGLVPQHPIANFTMNFLKGLELGKVSFDYIPCIRAINSTLITSLDFQNTYKTQGMEGVFDSVTVILSNLFDLNSTCQVAASELAYALSRYLIEFKDDNYFLAILREFPYKVDRWIEQTVKFKSCFYYGWWGCAGLAAGRFSNIVFNVTPKHKPKVLQEQINFEETRVVPNTRVTIQGETVRMILNATFNALETSWLISSRNASAVCEDLSEDFYNNFLLVVDMVIDSHDWKDAIYQLLFAFKNLNGMYRNCKSVLRGFVEVGSVYLSTMGNWKDLLNHAVFRSKPLMSRGMVTVESFKDKRFENFGSHIGYLINILLWQ